MKRIDKMAALARLKEPTAGRCRMCEMVETAPRIAATGHAVAIPDRYASRPFHALILARRHEEHVARMSWAEYGDMHRLAWLLARAMEVVLTPTRVFVAALGSREQRSTSSPHVHIHVVPLTHGGEEDRPANVFTWEQGVWVFDDVEEELAMCRSLAAALPMDHPTSS